MNAVNNSHRLTQIEIRKLKKEVKMCEGKRHFLWTGGIFACLLLSSFSYAGKVETIVVDSGYVVAYGKYIPPPYRITLKYGPLVDSFPFDTIFINDIAVSPYIKSEKELLVLSVHDIIKDSVKEIIAKYGVVNAKPYIETFLENFSKGDSVIEEWKIMFSEDRKNYTILLYDDNKECVTIVTYPMFHEGFIPSPDYKAPPKKTQRERNIGKLKHYAERLKNGKLITFGYYHPSPVDYITWLRQVKSILEKNVSDSTKRELLKEIGVPRMFSEEFIENKNEWKKLELDEEQNE